MDELLMSRVKHLQEIEEQLAKVIEQSILYSVTVELRQLRRDVLDMIRKAEEEHEAF